MGITLTIFIPVVLLAYAIWLVAGMVRRRRRGESVCGCGGCAGCPMAEGCRLAKKQEQDAAAAGNDTKGEKE
ncbi:MAG: FeoB-associated Cys-rich membrane protein [Clostridiales bacterium]|nr:FeoB-associated Cys-rich membrane protein [Clostridiales bacterium]